MRHAHTTGRLALGLIGTCVAFAIVHWFPESPVAIAAIILHAASWIALIATAHRILR